MGKITWIFGSVFGLVGLGLLTGAFFAAKSTLDFRSGSATAQGKVVDLVSYRDSDGDRMYKPEVEFTDEQGNSHRFTGSVGSSSPGYDRGETVTVRYRPDSPEGARLDSFMENWFLALILGGMGSIFFAIGAGFVVAAINKRRREAWLRRHGMRVQARYTGCMLDTSVAVNGRNPYRLHAQWQHPVTGAVHTFRSDMLFYDPSEYVQRETLDVLVDADDPTRHLVDLSFLPKHAG